MASLKTLKIRIGSVKSTQKITKAMKMVAAAKLRRAQANAEAGRPYATRLSQVVASLASRVTVGPQSPKLIAGTGSDQRHLIVVATGDRGLAGAFNTNIVRAARKQGRRTRSRGQDRPVLHRRPQGPPGDRALLPQGDHRPARHAGDEGAGLCRRAGDRQGHQRPLPERPVRRRASRLRQLPLDPAPGTDRRPDHPRRPRRASAETKGNVAASAIEYEPDEEAILAELLPRNVAIQIYRALLENAAGFYGSQMTAMDNATRNAGDMINKLSIAYNRQRQAAITTELVEIISGAEAL